MKIQWLTYLLLACSFAFSQTNSKYDLEYTVEFVTINTLPTIQVTFDYMNDCNGIISLRYENSSWGDNDIFNVIRDLTVSGKT